MATNEVILLSDIPNHSKETYAARYAGPYVVKSSLIETGIDAIVIDWFRYLDEDSFFNYLENFITTHTKCIGISTTFLLPNYGHSKKMGDGMSQLVANEDEKIDEAAVAASSLYLWEWTNEKLSKWFYKLRKCLDKKNPNAIIVLGGHRVNKIVQFCELAPADYAIKLYCDYLITGYADQMIIQLLEKINNKEQIVPSLEKQGLKVLMPDDKWKIAKNHVPRIRYTKADGIRSRHWLPLEVSRGCAFNCKFCNYEKRATVKKDMYLLSEELKRNYNEFGTQGYNITSDCFNDDRRFVGEWAETIGKLPFKIEWTSYARLDLYNRYPETMDEMLQSGFRAGWFGIETLYHEAGKAAGKGLSPEKVKYLMNELKRKSPEFWLTTYFIIGLPKETPESLDNTLEYLTKQRTIDEVQVSVLGVAPFIEELSSVVDFSDHSKMPEKFGFRKLQFTPTFYWEHDTLNNLQCNEIREKWKQTFYEHPYTRYGGGAHGEYPRIRDLGLDHKQTVVYLKTKFLGGNKIIDLDTKKKRAFKEHVIKLSKEHVQDYYHYMKEINNDRLLYG
jgi:radical SAM superfamily enzyme YgiQ (UPF0313 family)